MIDWTKSMQQTYEYYTVNPNTWLDEKKLDMVKSSSIDWDSSSDTLGSATFELDNQIGECYIRVYLIAIQNGQIKREPLGTFLVQTMPTSFDGKTKQLSIDAYTPLIELAEKKPDIGYFIAKGSNVMDEVNKMASSNMRAPVIFAKNDTPLHVTYVASTDDTWMTYISNLIRYANYELCLSTRGELLFSPKQPLSALTPIWTFDDGNSSILQPSVSVSNDLYGIPNVVEVVYSGSNGVYRSVVKNTDPASPTSIVARGREIHHRVMNPELTGDQDQNTIDEYAKRLLKEISSVEYTISYTHGYCPVRVGDCVRLDYKLAGLHNVKAKVISQSISCTPGCQVSETAVFSKQLWEANS